MHYNQINISILQVFDTVILLKGPSAHAVPILTEGLLSTNVLRA